MLIICAPQTGYLSKSERCSKGGDYRRSLSAGGRGGEIGGVVPGMLRVAPPHRQDAHQEGERGHDHLPRLARAKLTMASEDLHRDKR